jgi:hypothetical protein
MIYISINNRKSLIVSFFIRAYFILKVTENLFKYINSLAFLLIFFLENK